MSRQHQTRTSVASSTQKRKSCFTAPPVVQPKRNRQKKTKLPAWQPGTSGAVDPFVQLKATMALQAKLTIGQPNDKYEQEADRVAHDVVQRLHTPITNLAEPGPIINLKPMLQRSSALTGGEASTELESSINRAKGGGQSLDSGLQQSMGSSMGADFSGVKVHTDSTSDQLNQSIQARAFTTGSDVFFKKGEYNPGSKGGQELIAHELTHVVQQGGAGVQRSSDTVVQRWLKDGKTGNVMNDKVALKYLTDNKIPEQLAQITVDEAKKHGDPVQKAELLRIGRYAMMLANKIPEWTPIKIGEQLKYYIASPHHAEQPWSGSVGSDGRATSEGLNKVLTQKVVSHEEIGDYIPEEERQLILKRIADRHNVSQPPTPVYWVQDKVSEDGHFKTITHNNLRPVITPASFSEKPSISKKLYRGSGLSPIEAYDYGGFRAWGTDDDLYLHTLEEQKNRQHSAYVSNSIASSVAISFATKLGTKGVVYEIDPKGLFAIELNGYTKFPNEEEVVVPYHIPFKNITTISTMAGETYKMDELLEDGSVSLKRFSQELDLYDSLSSKQDDKDWESYAEEFEQDSQKPENRIPIDEEAFIEILMNEEKACYRSMKKAYEKNKLKPTSANSTYSALRRIKKFNRVVLDDGSGTLRTAKITPQAELEKEKRQPEKTAFTNLVTSWWANCYAPNNTLVDL